MCTVLGDTLRVGESPTCRGSPVARRRRSQQSARPYLSFSVPALRASQLDIASRRLEADRRWAAARAKLDHYLAEIEDARRFDPDRRSRNARSRSGRVAKVSMLSLLGSAQNFVDPFVGAIPTRPGRVASRPTVRPAGSPSRNVIVCVRRKVRREVIFAAGAGGGKVSRRRRRTTFSNIHC